MIKITITITAQAILTKEKNNLVDIKTKEKTNLEDIKITKNLMIGIKIIVDIKSRIDQIIQKISIQETITQTKIDKTTNKAITGTMIIKITITILIINRKITTTVMVKSPIHLSIITDLITIMTKTDLMINTRTTTTIPITILRMTILKKIIMEAQIRVIIVIVITKVLLITVRSKKCLIK